MARPDCLLFFEIGGRARINYPIGLRLFEIPEIDHKWSPDGLRASKWQSHFLFPVSIFHSREKKMTRPESLLFPQSRGRGSEQAAGRGNFPPGRPVATCFTRQTLRLIDLMTSTGVIDEKRVGIIDKGLGRALPIGYANHYTTSNS